MEALDVVQNAAISKKLYVKLYIEGQVIYIDKKSGLMQYLGETPRSTWNIREGWELGRIKCKQLVQNL